MHMGSENCILLMNGTDTFTNNTASLGHFNGTFALLNNTGSLFVFDSSLRILQFQGMLRQLTELKQTY